MNQLDCVKFSLILDAKPTVLCQVTTNLCHEKKHSWFLDEIGVWDENNVPWPPHQGSRGAGGLRTRARRVAGGSNERHNASSKAPEGPQRGPIRAQQTNGDAQSTPPGSANYWGGHLICGFALFGDGGCFYQSGVVLKGGRASGRFGPNSGRKIVPKIVQHRSKVNAFPRLRNSQLGHGAGAPWTRDMVYFI